MSKRFYISIFSGLVVVKLIVALAIYHGMGNHFFGGVSDAIYYHHYAIGEDNEIRNSWAVILRFLHDAHLYSRDVITYLMMFLGIIVIPCLVGLLATQRKAPITSSDFWLAAIITSLYPSLFFFTTDIYRDVVMIFLGLSFFYYTLHICEYKSKLAWVMALIISLVLFVLRPYFGAACLGTLIIAPWYSFRRFPLLPTLFVCLALLFGLYLLGVLDPIVVEYRTALHTLPSNSRIPNIGEQSWMFIPSFLFSALCQLGGLYFYDTKSAATFLIESLPFLWGIIYILRNRQYANKFVDYLIVFCVLYATVWLLGNDNLGTAVRLRIINYLVVLVGYFVIKREKTYAQTAQ